MQKFQVKSQVLSDALSRICHAVDDKAVTPAFSGVKLEVGEHYLRLSTVGSTINTEALVPLDGATGPAVFGLGLKLFSEVIATLPAAVSVEFTVGERDVVVAAGGSRFKLNLLAEAASLPGQGLTERVYSPINIAALLEGVGKVIYCHDDKAGEVYKRSVCINPQHLVSTDGFRLSYFPNKAFSAEWHTMVLLLTPSVEKLAKIYSGMASEAGIAANATGVYLHCGGIYTATRVPEQRYPNYVSILPKTPYQPCLVARAALLESMKRVLVLIGEKGIKNVDFIFDGGRLALSSSGMVGDALDTLAVETAAQGTVRLNGEFVVKALSKMSSKLVTLEYRSGGGPLIFTDGEHVNVFQPIPTGSVPAQQGGS